MKCSNCQALVDEGMTTCPYCKAPLNNTDVLPATPSAPVLPEDQGMDVASVEAAKPVSLAGEQMSQEETINTESVVTDTPVPEAPSENIATPNIEVDTTVIKENAMNPDGSQGSFVENVDGQKIASSQAPKETKKKKKPLIFAIIAIIVVLLLAGGFYYYEYMSANKRIDAVVNGLLKFTNNISNESMKKSSGSYAINGKLSLDNNSYDMGLDGDFGYDLSKNIIDLKLNLNTLKIANEDYIPEAIKSEIFIKDNKIYVSIPTFYNKFIVGEIQGLDFSKMTENEVNYQLINNSFKNAIKSSLKAAKNKQEVKKVNISSKSQTVNSITINLNESNSKIMYNTFMNVLANDTTLLTELSKLTGESTEEIKKSFTENNEFEYAIDPNSSISIYTDMFKNELEGIIVNVKNKEDVEWSSCKLLPITNGYKLSIKNEKDTVDIEYSDVFSRTTNTSDNKINLKITAKLDNKDVSATVEFSKKMDNEANVKEPVLKDVVEFEKIPQADLMQIITKVSTFGKLGSLLMPQTPGITQTPTVPTPSTPETSSTPQTPSVTTPSVTTPKVTTPSVSSTKSAGNVSSTKQAAQTY